MPFSSFSSLALAPLSIAASTAASAATALAHRCSLLSPTRCAAATNVACRSMSTSSTTTTSTGAISSNPSPSAARARPSPPPASVFPSPVTSGWATGVASPSVAMRTSSANGSSHMNLQPSTCDLSPMTAAAASAPVAAPHAIGYPPRLRSRAAQQQQQQKSRAYAQRMHTSARSWDGGAAVATSSVDEFHHPVSQSFAASLEADDNHHEDDDDGCCHLDPFLSTCNAVNPPQYWHASIMDAELPPETPAPAAAAAVSSSCALDGSQSQSQRHMRSCSNKQFDIDWRDVPVPACIKRQHPASAHSNAASSPVHSSSASTASSSIPLSRMAAMDASSMLLQSEANKVRLVLAPVVWDATHHVDGYERNHTTDDADLESINQRPYPLAL